MDGDIAIRVYNVIIENSPAFDILNAWAGALQVSRVQLVTLFESYWLEQEPTSAHPHFPILDRAACWSMFQVVLSEIDSDFMMVDGNHPTPAAIKGVVLAICALSAKYNFRGMEEFYFRCACRTIDFIPNNVSLECVLLNTLLVRFGS